MLKGTDTVINGKESGSVVINQPFMIGWEGLDIYCINLAHRYRRNMNPLSILPTNERRGLRHVVNTDHRDVIGYPNGTWVGQCAEVAAMLFSKHRLKTSPPRRADWHSVVFSACSNLRKLHYCTATKTITRWLPMNGAPY